MKKAIDKFFKWGFYPIVLNAIASSYILEFHGLVLFFALGLLLSNLFAEIAIHYSKKLDAANADYIETLKSGIAERDKMAAAILKGGK